MTTTRGQLHAWIWQVPITELAQVLHMSSKSLNRICVKHRIPTPPRGHWRRVETGKAVVRIPLPDPDAGEGLVLEVDEAAVAALLANHTPVQASASPVQAPALPGLGTPASPVEPSWDSILEMAERHGRWQLAEVFLEEVGGAMPTCNPATLAVLTLWMDRAREALARADPVALVTGSCERIASGVEAPAWWTSVSRKDC